MMFGYLNTVTTYVLASLVRLDGNIGELNYARMSYVVNDCQDERDAYGTRKWLPAVRAYGTENDPSRWVLSSIFPFNEPSRKF